MALSPQWLLSPKRRVRRDEFDFDGKTPQSTQDHVQRRCVARPLAERRSRAMLTLVSTPEARS
jgi:hypothetical protein